MYPNLRYAFYDIFGLDIPALSLIQTYGFFLALTFVACGIALSADLKRREKLGILQGIEEEVEVGLPLSFMDIISNVIMGFILGFKGVYAIIHPKLFIGNNAKDNLFSMDHGYWWAGIIIAAFLVFIKYRDKIKECTEYPNRQKITKTIMPHQRVTDIVILAAISGVIGAKLLYMTERDYPTWSAMIEDFFSGSGLAVYGGFILAFFVVSYYVRSKKIPLPQLFDACAPAMILGTGLGRLGCHFSGDGDWGDPNPFAKPFAWLPDWLWAYNYPNNVMNTNLLMEDCYYPADFGDYCHMLSKPVFPTPIFELIICLIIFAILWKLRHKVQLHGIVFTVYLFFTGLQRFLLEMIRVNDDYTVAGLSLSQAQYIAVILMVLGFGLTSIMLIKQKKMPVSGNNTTA
ncbi:MAG: prolipoprotein diacylglyceryl transferase [Saprospiraceae bacterium]|nr:prolipoprotein diacylglyceryl transferase [Saprospiraceae bacterium]